jgi:hypothetical protein
VGQAWRATKEDEKTRREARDARAKMKSQRGIKKVRGVFEKEPGSGVWWVQFFDAAGRRRREKVGSRANAIDLYRKRKTEVLTGIGRLEEEFGNRPAVIPMKNLRDWFDAQKWRPGTYNRYKTTLSLIYRLGTENNKVESNPAKLIKHKTEDNERVRFLN